MTLKLDQVLQVRSYTSTTPSCHKMANNLSTSTVGSVNGTKWRKALRRIQLVPDFSVCFVAI